MSFAINNYTGNGSTTTFSVTFPYITQSHVQVRLNNVLKTLGVDYTFPTSSTIQFTTAPANGVNINFKRSSNQSARLVDFQDGSTITESILDQDSNQMFYMSQEAIDITTNTINLDTDDKYDAQSKVIKNLANPVNANDAVNKTYLENTWLSTADKSALTTVNANIANINAVNSNSANINTVASDLLEAVSEINTVAVSIANVDTVGTNIANVNTVAGNNANINTVASANSNITTVAGANANITAVAGQITPTNNVSTVAGAVANIGTVATNIANVNLVGGSIANVNTVASANANITTVATANTNIGTVAGAIANVNSVGGSIANVNSVAGNSTNINAVNANSANINTVAGANANITTLAGISGAISTVASNAGNISTVATDIAKVITAANDLNEAISEIDTVSNSIANVDTVGTNIANVNTVATNIANINSVNSNSSNINAVNANATNINTVATANTNITSVAGSIANINTVASNIGTVNDFSARYRVASSDPTTSKDAGDLAFNTTANALKYYNGTTWEAIVAGGLTDVVQDGTPQLGGSLDVNGNSIVSVSNGNINITPNGTGQVILDGISYPTSIGTAGQSLVVNSSVTGLEFTTLQASEISTVGNYFSNWNEISSDLTTTTSTIKNQFLCGDITVSGNATWDIQGNGALSII